MMISQFYVLSPRGDTIINRDFRGDVAKGTADIFFRNVKSLGNNAPPIFVLDGVAYAFLKRGGLYFVITTQANISPAFALEFLDRATKIFKDFCGVLNEEALRRNFVLVYEVLEEILDFGIPQPTSTDKLKECIHNEAVLVEPPPQKTAGVAAVGALRSVAFPQSNPKTVPSNASHRPVVPTTQPDATAVRVLGAAGVRLSATPRNEVFVDILEHLTVVMNAVGDVINATADGSIQIKSYLRGAPELRLALNEDLLIRSNEPYDAESAVPTYRYSTQPVTLDDANFHESVNLKEFETSRVMSLLPPEGEFVAMNYRINGKIKVPIRVYPVVEYKSARKLEISISLRGTFPEEHHASGVRVVCPFPPTTSVANLQTLPTGPGQFSEFNKPDSRLVWTISRLQGNGEVSIRCRLSLDEDFVPEECPDKKEKVVMKLKKLIGPISLVFEIPMFTPSGLQVRYLRIEEPLVTAYGRGAFGSNFGATSKTAAPYRWVRYVTQTRSYICRL